MLEIRPGVYFDKDDNVLCIYPPKLLEEAGVQVTQETILAVYATVVANRDALFPDYPQDSIGIVLIEADAPSTFDDINNTGATPDGQNT